MDNFMIEIETREIYNAETGEKMGTISMPVNTPERQWNDSLAKLENATWEKP